MHEIDLSAAADFAEASLAYEAVAPFGDEGLDGHAFCRRRRHQGKVAKPAEGHVERAGNWRRGERQHVHVGAHLLEPFLVADTETVLLVDYDEPEVAKRHVALQQAMGADDDVDLAGLEALDDGLLFGSGAKARKVFDTHRPVCEAVGECLGMLLRKERRRNEHRGLAAAGDRGEAGAQRDLGLAESHVAADDAVHRAPRSHVGEDRLDRIVLVDRLLERKRGLEAR